MFGLSNAFPAPAPQPLRDLFTSVPSEHQPLPPATKDFKQNIRAYNYALQMASTGLHIHSPEQGINMIAIKRVVHHLLGPLQPAEHDVPQFAQLYIIDSMNAQVIAHSKLQDRNPTSHALFVYGKRLYQEWVVDQYSKVESQRLFYIRNNQGPLRAAIYGGVVDAIANNDANIDNLGRLIVLPSSFIGGHRHMA